MALTVALPTGGLLGKQPSAPTFCMALDIAFDNSYPTGGEPFDAAAEVRSKGNFDKTPTVIGVMIESKGGYVFTYDRANAKILAYYGDYDPAAAAPLAEVPNETNLAAVTGVRALVFFQ